MTAQHDALVTGALPPSDPAWAVALGVTHNLGSLKHSPAMRSLLARIACCSSDAGTQAQAMTILADNALAAAAQADSDAANVTVLATEGHSFDGRGTDAGGVHHLDFGRVLEVALELAVHPASDVR